MTFAEVAIWKENPGAQFQLMRKHPIRDRISYVLGKQVEQNPVLTDAQLLYKSSNGDQWCLTRDPVSGREP